MKVDISAHERRIGAMFDRVSRRYDGLNRILSFGVDQRWRRRATDLARLGPHERALDVGAGTGDLALAILRSSAADTRVTAVDLSASMLRLCGLRAAGAGLTRRIDRVVGTANALPFPDASVDRVIAGFAVRNFADLAAGLREFRRVLCPGGRAVVLELSTPPNRLFGAIYRFYFEQLSPRVATFIGGDPEAYRYLPASVARHPSAEAVAALMRVAGFSAVRFERLTFGAATIHVGEA